jgi:beta-glucosidase
MNREHEKALALLRQMTLREKTSQLLHESPGIPRLGIPSYNWWNECLHGVARAGRATIFPQAIGLAATFNEKLIERVSRVISNEGRAKYHAAVAAGNRGQYRGLTYWTPNVNIFRDPRWGRGQETYGEDPWLTARLGLAFVHGLQEERNGVLKAAACAKHFAVHSGPEAERHQFDAEVSEQDLRDTYLPAFEALVREGPVEAVMGAYNRLNGEPCCGSPRLLQEILREEWGFTGHVVSDCWAIRDFHEHHHVTATPAESVALAIESGCDLNCGCTFGFAEEAVEQGLLSEKAIDDAVLRLLVTRIRLGLLDPPEENPWGHLSLEIVQSPEHRLLAREAAVQSLVLLKNNGILPLSPDLKTLYITGPNASNPDALLGNYYGMSDNIVTPLEGIAARAPEGVTVDYRKGALLDREKVNPVDWAVFESARMEVTIAFLGIDGTLEGEEGDAIASPYKGDREEIGLPPGQLDFLRRMKEQGAPVVVVLSGGSALAVPEVHELADAVIMAWYPGEQGGRAIADVLFGDRSPSGALPVTFYRSVEDLPPYGDYSMDGRTYRYFTGDPLYPFGFGLSYTQFAFGSSDVTVHDNHVEIHGTLQNIGSVPGDAPVQLYISPPQGVAPYRVPLAFLCGIQRIFLEPEEERTFSFVIEKSAFRVIDEEGQRERLPGPWNITVGLCAPGNRGRELGAAEPIEKALTL